jgi:hypothetical protein
VKSIASGGTGSKTTIHINGKTYSSLEDLPAPLRAIVGGLTTFALGRAGAGTSESPGADIRFEPAAAAVRPEAVLTLKTIFVAIGLAALLLFLLRLVL